MIRPPSSSGLGHHSLTVETPVQIRLAAQVVKVLLLVRRQFILTDNILGYLAKQRSGAAASH